MPAARSGGGGGAGRWPTPRSWRLLGRGWQARLDKAHPGRQALTQTLVQHATNVGAAAPVSSAPAGTFLRAELFSRISQEVV